MSDVMASLVIDDNFEACRVDILYKCLNLGHQSDTVASLFGGR